MCFLDACRSLNNLPLILAHGCRTTVVPCLSTRLTGNTTHALAELRHSTNRALDMVVWDLLLERRAPL